VQTVATVSDAEIQARVDAAVAKAVGEVQKSQTLQTKSLIADLAEARYRLQLAADQYDQSLKRSGARWLTAGLVGPPQGDLQ
jgi:hypothetical protein